MESENSIKIDDWEAESASPVLNKDKPKNAWDDEDADENDVKESWEDEDDQPQVCPDPLTSVQEAPKEKAPKKVAVVKKDKIVTVNETPLDPVAEKLRHQRLVEEADYESTTELFGKKEGEAEDEKSIDRFIPKTENDFLEYAQLISHKIRLYEKSFHYVGLLKAVMRLSTVSLKAADTKEVASSITAIANEKLKAERESNAGKKKMGGRRKQLQVDREADIVMDKYDAVDDYEFM